MAKHRLNLVSRGLTIASNAPKVDKRTKAGKGDARDWASSGEWAQVKSSNVEAIQYHPVRRELQVKFLSKNGKPSTYRYRNVPLEVAEAMFNSSSMGKFVAFRLKNKFSFEGPY